MLWTALMLFVGWVIGGLTPVTFNRFRRWSLSGKMFGKLPEGAKDPTRP